MLSNQFYIDANSLAIPSGKPKYSQLRSRLVPTTLAVEERKTELLNNRIMKLKLYNQSISTVFFDLILDQL